MSELVDAIDERDAVIGTFERSMASRLGLALRVSGVLVVSKRGTLYLQVRSSLKTYPGRYDYSAAGHVLSGEDYLNAAHRELKEELGIEAVLRHIGIVRATTDDGKLKKLHHVFVARHDGPFTLFKDEVEDVHEFSLDHLGQAIGNTPELFTPTFRLVFEQVMLSMDFSA